MEISLLPRGGTSLQLAKKNKMMYAFSYVSRVYPRNFQKGVLIDNRDHTPYPTTAPL